MATTPEPSITEICRRPTGMVIGPAAASLTANAGGVTSNSTSTTGNWLTASPAESVQASPR